MLGFDSVSEFFVAVLAMTSGLFTNTIGSRNHASQSFIVSSRDNDNHRSLIFPGAHPATLTPDGVKFSDDRHCIR